MGKVEPNIRLASENNSTFEGSIATSVSNPTCAWRVIVALTLNPMGTAYQTLGGMGTEGNGGMKDKCYGADERLARRSGWLTVFEK